MDDSEKLNFIMLSPEEQNLQDTIDKLTDELYSQLGIPKWEAGSAVKTAIKTYDAYILENLRRKSK